MGRTFHVFIDHVAADADLAEGLRAHLRPAVRRGLVDLLPKDSELLGTVEARALREAVLDADLYLPLLSAGFLADDDAEDRLRLGHRRHQEGSVQLLPVLASACPFDPVDYPGLRTLPTGKALRTMTDREAGFTAITAAMQQTIDLLQRHPFGQNPTLRRVANDAFRLDRTAQWETLRERCAARQHTLFLLHGRRGQAVSLFAERAGQLLGAERGTPLRLLQVPIRAGVANAHDLENKLRGVLAQALEGEADDAGKLLQRLTRKARLFLLLGGVQNDRWPLRDRQALADFLVQRLPRILPDLRPTEGNPVSLLLMLEYERPETSLVPWALEAAKALQGPLHFCPLPEAVLPSWAEVEGVLTSKGASLETIAELRAFYDELTRGPAPSFEALADRLDSYLL